MGKFFDELLESVQQMDEIVKRDQVKWTEIGHNTWRFGDVIVYLAQLPHPVYFATKQGEQRKFTDKKEMVSWVKS